MRTAIWAATAAVLALAGCGWGGGDGGNQAGAKAPEERVDARPPDEPREPTEAPSEYDASANEEIRDLLVGRWTDSGDCATAIDIRADGSFASPAGTGRWTLENERLTLSGEGRDMQFAVREIDPQGMATVNPRGRIGRWSRC